MNCPPRKEGVRRLLKAKAAWCWYGQRRRLWLKKGGGRKGLTEEKKIFFVGRRGFFAVLERREWKGKEGRSLAEISLRPKSLETDVRKERDGFFLSSRPTTHFRKRGKSRKIKKGENRVHCKAGRNIAEPLPCFARGAPNLSRNSRTLIQPEFSPPFTS